MKKPFRPDETIPTVVVPKNDQLLESMPAQQLDDLTLLAASICQAPSALIGFIVEGRFLIKSIHGFAANESPSELALCDATMNEPANFVVEDTLLDGRFKVSRIVATERDARFFAGIQIRNSDGEKVGTLYVIDHRPRKLSNDQLQALEALSRTAGAFIEKYRKRHALDKQTKFLNSVMGALPNLVAYVDQEFKYRYANSAYETWFGLAAPSLLGRTVQEVMGQETFTIGRGFMERALSGHLVEFQRKLPYRFNGKLQPRTVRVNYIPDVADDGTVAGIFAVITDLSDKTIALEKLDAKEREVQSIFDALPAMIGHWDKNQLNLSANRAYSQYFDKSPNQIKGKHLCDLLGQEIYQKNLPFIEGVLNGIPQTFERVLPVKDGKLRYTLANYLPDIEGGAVKGFFVIVTDISAVKTLENERKTLEAKMISSSKLAELGEMAGGIAHEINSPLASIMGRVGLMKERVALNEFDAELFSRDLAKIEMTTDRIAKIVSGLKAFSRSADNDPMAEVSVDLLVQNTLELCQERFKNEGIELRVSIPKGMSVQCRESQVSQILLNLLGNSLDAIKAVPEKWVSLELEATSETLRFFVTDSGRGIPDETAAKIMQPFFTTKEIGKGTGLGLSVSFGLAQAHGGNLFYVKESKNTRFCLELPIRSLQGRAA